MAESAAAPIPVRLPCPSCGELHVDVGEFASRPHHTHACQVCGMVWRPALVATVGVRFLPGFRDEPVAEVEPRGLVAGPEVPTEVLAGPPPVSPVRARPGGRGGRPRGEVSTAVLEFMTAQGGVWSVTSLRFHESFSDGVSTAQVKSALASLHRAGLIVRAGKPGQYQVVGDDDVVAGAEVAEPASARVGGESDPIARTRVDPDAARGRAAGAMFGEGQRSHDLRGARG